MYENKKIGFIGGGMVAEAIIRGLILHGHEASKIFVSDPSESRRDVLSILNKQLNVESDNQAIASQVEIVIMAVKPQIFTNVAEDLDLGSENSPMIISVAAGIEMETMKNLFGKDKKICRVMPNTPCLVGRGVSALIQSNLNESDIVMATYIFNSVGKTIWIQKEEWMHAVTAVSGSGPAYFFQMMHILKSAAIKAGIPEEIAETLSIQTAIGSSQLALNSADDLLTLKKKVMSPGGTTEAAFDFLEEKKLDDIWDEAIDAARQRSVDLGKD
tara:strand:- start:101 stop:916 length:816 start_codon:yes stop_codon:yes gene_type:complete